MSDYLSFSLSDEFVDGYKNKKVDWKFDIGGGNSLAELTFLLKYSRKKEDGTKEKWYEVCRRSVEGMYSILKDHCTSQRTSWNDLKAQKSAQDAFDRMFHFKWTPPGRGLEHMGTRFVHENKNAGPLQNCFTGDVEFVTRNGIQALSETGVVDIWSKGAWREANIRSFGIQPIQRVVFKPDQIRTSIRNEFKVTPDHKWILSDNTETTSLKNGDVIKGEVVKPVTSGDEYNNGLLHGLIFGDGGKTSHPYQDGRRGYELRACDSRTDEMARILDMQGKWDNVYKDRPSGNGDVFYFLRSSIDLKEFPVAPHPSYARGFIEGWILADASIKPSGSYRLDSQRVDSTEWLERYAAFAGFTLTGFAIESKDTNFGPRKNPLRRHTLVDGAVDWRVVEIEDLEVEEEVFCAEVPHVHAFTLSSGILTGNCGFLSTEKLSAHSAWEATGPFVRMMEMSMNGIGIGFDLRGADKLQLHQPSGEPVKFVIQDTRESWAESMGVLLESYFFKNRGPVEFDYSLIRPKGTPLSTFGGTASGYEPLYDCHEMVRKLLGDRDDKLNSRDIVDIMNLIGKAVVAGGIRRTAEICFGDPDDEDYIGIKDWNDERNSQRMGPDGWGWTSNNSVFVNVGQDYSDLIDRIKVNGEPGFMWLDLARDYGRMIDPPTGADYRAMGGNPCLEQTLESWEVCTLVETFPSNHKDFADYRETLKHAYLYGKAVTLMPTLWPETNAVMNRNRRIGTSMTGLAEFVEERGWGELRNWMDEGYKFIQHRDKKYSEWLAVRESIKTTSIKPSGTVSLIAGVTPGVHWPTTSDHYIRRIRFNNDNPLLEIIEKSGYHIEPSKDDPKNTVVVEFPTRGSNIRSEREVSVWEKAELASLAQRFWADNQVSATLSFRPEEADALAPLLAAKDGQFKGVSFLPIDDSGTTYAQAPYEPIKEEKADEMRQNLKKFDTRALYRVDLENQGDKFCGNDTCEIPLK